MAEAPPLPPGSQIGNYLTSEQLGEGGFGAVYRARHVLTKKEVALKVLHPEVRATNPQTVIRFRREASIGNEINHENVIESYDAGDHDGHLYIAMELLRGSALSDEVKRAGALPADRIIHIVDQICQALSAAHQKGIIHRDLKPANIFLTVRGGQADFVKVLDFGIAKFVDSQPDSFKTASHQFIGSPLTMSPEQCLGSEVDARSDIYSLGVVVFYLTTGRFPFEGPPLHVATNHLSATPPKASSLNPHILPHLEAIIERAMQKRAADRFQHVDELRVALHTPELLSPDQATVSASLKTVDTSPSSRTTVMSAPAPLATPASRLARRIAIIGTASAIVTGSIAVGVQMQKTRHEENVRRAVADFTGGAPAEPTPSPPPVAAPEPAPTAAAAPTPTAPIDPAPAPPAAAPAKVLPKNATLLVRIKPWAKVTVDGRQSDFSPCHFALAAGTHKVSFANEPLGKKETRKVTLRANETKKIEFSWE